MQSHLLLGQNAMKKGTQSYQLPADLFGAKLARISHATNRLAAGHSLHTIVSDWNRIQNILFYCGTRVWIINTIFIILTLWPLYFVSRSLASVLVTSEQKQWARPLGYNIAEDSNNINSKFYFEGSLHQSHSYGLTISSILMYRVRKNYCTKWDCAETEHILFVLCDQCLAETAILIFLKWQHRWY